jgi:dTDP-glucose 4,6-dehydratase
MNLISHPVKVALLGGGNVYALNLAAHLHAHGIEHFGIGRSPRKPQAMWAQHHYRYYQAHLVSQLPAVMAWLDTERPDVVVNFAAQGEGQGSFGDRADLFYQTNTLALARLVEQLRHRDYLRRFVQIGTSELYGSVTAPSKESDALVPSSPYAVSKAAFDQHLAIMYRVHGFPCNVVRPSNAYCRGQQLHRIIPKAIICALRHEKLQLQGGGRAEKSYIHASDLSRAVMLVAEKAPMGEVYNCGPCLPNSIASVVALCAEACGVPFDELVQITGDRVGQDGRYHLDSRKLAALGWSQQIPLAEGISDMVEWIKANPEILQMPTDWEIKA